MKRLTGLYLVCGAALLASATLVAQQPPAGAPPAGGRAGGPPAPMQLKVLPNTWTRQQVGQLMQTFNESLGVQCTHCHAEGATGNPNPTTGLRPPDYALDTKPEKEIAREMIKAVMSANEATKGLGDATVVEKMSCWTCHRGATKPEKQPAAGWGRGNFTLSQAGPTVPQRGGGAPGGAPPAGAPPAGGRGQ